MSHAHTPTAGQLRGSLLLWALCNSGCLRTGLEMQPVTFVFVADANTVVAGAPLKMNLQAVDVRGNPADYYSGLVMFSVDDPTATVPPAYLFAANPQGLGIPALYTVRRAGVRTMHVWDAATPTQVSEATVKVLAGTASSLEVVAAGPTTSGVLPPLTVTVVDGFGNPVGNYTGTLTTTLAPSGTQLPPVAFATDGEGTATISLGQVNASGTDTVTVQDTESGAAGTLTIIVPPPNVFQMTLTLPAQTPAGAAQTVNLRISGDSNATAAPYTGTVLFTSTDPSCTLPRSYTFTATDAGAHVFTQVTWTTAGPQTVTAQDNDNSSLATTQVITVDPGGAQSLALTSLADSTAGQIQTAKVTAYDAYGNVATGYNGVVHFSSSDSQATLPSDYQFSASDAGTATFSGGVTLATAGSQSVSANDGNFTASQTGLVVSPAAATAWVFAVPTILTAGTAVSATLTAYDAYGNRATGYSGNIHFSSTDAAAQLPGDAGLTSGVGTYINAITLSTAGNQTISVSGTGGLTQTVALTVNPGAATHVTLSGLTNSTAGQAQTAQVTAYDAAGNIAKGYTGLVHFTSSDSSATLPSAFQFTASNAGTATFTGGVTLKIAGSQTVSLSDGSLTANQTVVVSPATATTLTLAVPTTLTAGTAVSGSVTAHDAYGNVATGYTGTLHFTSTDANAQLPADAAPSAGVGTYTNAITFSTAGSQAISVSGTGGLTQTLALTVNPGAATHLTLSGLTNSTAGQAQTAQVTAYDAAGNIAKGYTGLIHFTSSDSSATLPSAFQFTASNIGTATFTGGVTLKIVGSQTVSLSDGSLTTHQTGLVVSPAAATTLTLSMPTTLTSGTAVSGSIAAHDAYGNAATTYAGTIHFTSTDGGAHLPADAALSAGVGTYNNAITFSTAGSQTISVSGTGGLTQTLALTVNPGAATHLTLSGLTNSTAGLAQTAQVTAYDAAGNIAKGYTGPIHFSSSDSSAILPSDFQFTASNAGAAIFTGGFTLKTVGTQSVVVTATLSDSSLWVTQSNVVISPAAATTLILAVPTTLTAGTAVSGSVTAHDAYGNVATGYTGTLHFTSTDANAQLPADAAPSAGVGTYTNAITFSTAGSQAISVSGTGGLTQTLALTVNPGAATHLTLSGLTNSTAGQAQTAQVTAYDAAGNIAKGYTGLIHFTSSDSSATLPSAFQFTASNAGTATFTGGVTLKIAGSQTVSLSDGSLTGNQTGLVVSPAAATTLTLSMPTTLTSGTAVSGSIAAHDAYGNVATTYAGTIHFTSTDGGAHLPADAALSAGVGTYNNAITFSTAGSQTISVSGTGGLTQTLALTVNPGAATHLTLSGLANSIAGQAQTAQVTAYDAAGNIAKGYTGLIHFTSSDSSATLPSAFQFTASNTGTATFTGGVTLKIAGSQTVSLSDGSLTANQTGLVVSPAAATTLTLSMPTTLTSGTAVSGSIAAHDAYGNAATTYAGTIHFTSTDASAHLPPNAALSAGVGTYTNAITFFTAGSQSISVSGTGGLTQTVALTVNPGAATHLTLSGLASSTAGQAQTAQVTAYDAWGNIAKGYTGLIHFSSLDSSATLPSDFLFNAGVGTATFAGGVTLKIVGTQTVTISDGSLTANQTGLVVSPAAAASLAFSTPTTLTAGTAVSGSVTAHDAYGNVATGYAGTIHFTSTDSSAQLPADAGLSAGVGTYTNSITLDTAGSQSISVAGTGVTGKTMAVTVNPSTAVRMQLSALPANSPAGTSETVTLTLFDNYNNIATGYTATASLTSSDANAALPASHTFPGATGTWITSVTFNTAGLTQTLTATDGTLTAPSVSTFVTRIGNSTGVIETLAQVWQSGFNAATYDNGRYWLAYLGTSNNLKMISSIDTVTWTAASTIHTGQTGGNALGVYYDGTNVHYAVGNGLGKTLDYRRGLLNSDGSITWAAAVQTALAASATYSWSNPLISVDSTGAPWISYLPVNSSGGFYDGRLASSTDTAGGWTARSGYPISYDSSYAVHEGIPVPLSGGKFYLVNYSSTYVHGQLWSGTAFGTSQTICSGGSIAANASGANVNLISQQSGNAYFYQRNGTTGTWGASTEVATNVQNSGSPLAWQANLATVAGTSDLYFLWLDPADHLIYSVRQTSGTWASTPTVCVAEPSDTIDTMTTSNVTNGGKLGVAYHDATTNVVKFILCP